MQNGSSASRYLFALLGGAAVAYAVVHFVPGAAPGAGGSTPSPHLPLPALSSLPPLPSLEAFTRLGAKPSADAGAPNAAAPAAAPIVEEVPVPGDLPVFVVRGDGSGRPLRTVFLTGSCTHPFPSVSAFRKAAAEHGGVVALQGDVPCAGKPSSLRRWSRDAAALHARIEAALRAAGAPATSDLTLMGYSQGAERAEWLGSRFRAEYTRFALLAGPVVPTAAHLADARGVVTMAAWGDARETMESGARRLRRARIPAVYMELPSGEHGHLGPEADAVIGRALDWLDAPPEVKAARSAALREKRP